MTLRRILTACALALLIGVPAARADTTFTVDTTEDNASLTSCTATAGDCSLRGAITAANDTNGADTIIVPAGHYELTIASTDEDANGDGDLDITEDLTISGSGAAVTVIDAAGIDRVLHIIDGTTHRIEGVTITGGAQGDGGGIYHTFGNLTVANTVIVDNNLPGMTAGGGIASAGNVDLTITQSTIAQNSAAIAGGVAFNGADLTVVNSTFSGNTSTGEGGALGLCLDDSFCGTLSIVNSTLAQNEATNGGGIFHNTGLTSVSLTNTIIAGNIASAGLGVPGCYHEQGTDPFTTDGNNLFTTANGCAVGTSDIATADALSTILNPALTTNGLGTRTLPLIPGSPAVDAGDSAACADLDTVSGVDQAGETRPTACDIGADELVEVGGTLDTTFNGQGYTVADPGAGTAFFTAIVEELNGATFAAGTDGSDMIVARFNADGTLDTTFGTAGFATVDFNGGEDIALNMALAPDGAIVLAGRAETGNATGDYVAALARLDPTGSPDSGFDGDGKATFPSMGEGSPDDLITDPGVPLPALGGLVIEEDGTIMVAGIGLVEPITDLFATRGVLLRVNNDGALDTSFDDDGVLLYTRGLDSTAFSGLNALSDGTYVAKGVSVDISLNTTVIAVKVDSSGAPVDTYGTNGEAAYAPDYQLLPVGTVLDADERVLISSIALVDDEVQVAITRFDTSGSPDTTFSGDGTALLNLSYHPNDAQNEQAALLTTQPDGKVLLALTTKAVKSADPSADGDEEARILRLNSDGTLDTTFGSGGLATLNLSTDDEEAQAVILDSSSRIVIAGQGQGNDLLVARFLIDTAPDAAPSDLTATATGDASIDLGWTDNSSNETGFLIERSPNGTDGWVEAGTVEAGITTFTDSTGLTCETTYHYRVSAVNGLAIGDPSNVANATTDTCSVIPAAPSDLTATRSSDTQIDLAWVDNSGSEEGFRVERSADGGTTWAQIAEVNANVTTYNDTSLACGTFTYRVLAYSAGGTSAASNTASATTVDCPEGPALLNASFEEDFNPDTGWMLRTISGPDGPFTFAPAPDGERVLLLDGSGGIEGVEQFVDLSGSAGDTVTLTFITGGRNTTTEGFIGGQIRLLDGDTLVGICTVIAPDESTFAQIERTCTATADAAFTRVLVRLGGLNVPGGFYGFDDVRLESN